MHWKVRLLLACGWACTLLPVLMPGTARAELRAPEAVVKAAVVFNVLAFVKWPETHAAGGERLLLCVLGDEATDQQLLQQTGGQVQGRRLVVERLALSLYEQQGCQAVFIGSANSPLIYRVAAANPGRPVLLLGEGPSAQENGAMIVLSLSADRFVLDVNATALREAGLIVSSKLLRLARRINH